MGNQTGRPVNNAQDILPRSSVENSPRDLREFQQPGTSSISFAPNNNDVSDEVNVETNADAAQSENALTLTRENLVAINPTASSIIVNNDNYSARNSSRLNEDEGASNDNNTPRASRWNSNSSSFSLRSIRPSSLGFNRATSVDGSTSSGNGKEDGSSLTSLNGVVSVHINAMPSHRMQNLAEDNTVKVSGKRGTLFSGINCNTALVAQSMECLKLNRPRDFCLGDSRASQLLITHIDGWYAVPTPDAFSRHQGTCLIVGDKNYTSQPYTLKLGDCFRLGSVGLVVSEIKRANGSEERLNSRTLQYLRDEALSFEDNDDDAALLAEERGNFCESPHSSPGKLMKENPTIIESPPICYMCYESTDTKEDPMVAPCDCKGDTRYLHVQCLLKWHHLSGNTNQQVVRTAGNGAPACKICGSAYKTTFRDASGKRLSLLEMDNSVPYLSLIVFTKHDTNPTLFNTKFRLNFGRSPTRQRADVNNALTSLTIGRSSQCEMILDYRTVSTNHARISYENNQFILQDIGSSNGTMVYVREPIPLPYGRNVRFRMGRCTLNVQAKRSWLASVRGSINRASSSLRRTSLLPRAKDDTPPQTPSEFFEQLTRTITMYNAHLTTALQKAAQERSVERSLARAAEKSSAAANIEAMTGTTAVDEMIITSSNGNTNGISSSEKQSASSRVHLLTNIDANNISDANGTNGIRDQIFYDTNGDEGGIFVAPDEPQNDADLLDSTKATVEKNVDSSNSSSDIVNGNEQRKRKIVDNNVAIEKKENEYADLKEQVENVEQIEGQVVLSCHVGDEISSTDMDSAPGTLNSPGGIVTEAIHNNDTESLPVDAKVMMVDTERGIKLQKVTTGGGQSVRESDSVYIDSAGDRAEETAGEGEIKVVSGSSPSSKASPHRASTPKLEFPNASTPRGSVIDAEYSVSMPNTVISPSGLALPSTEQHDVVVMVDRDEPSSPNRAKETSPSSEKPMSRGNSIG